VAVIRVNRSKRKLLRRFKKLQAAVEASARNLKGAEKLPLKKEIALEKLIWNNQPFEFRVGENPCFSRKAKGRFWENFTVYPETGPKERSRSWGFWKFLPLVIYAAALVLIRTNAGEFIAMAALAVK